MRELRKRKCFSDQAGRPVRPRGFTLLEVMVAALLLLLAMAGVVPFFISALSQSTAVRYKSSATNIARERLEQIRQLDYREITNAASLVARFGDSTTLRNVAYDVAYNVQEAAYGSGVLKEVTVTVAWTAPPRVAPVSLTTMIHQQFVGPRVSQVALSPPGQSDPLGTPFSCLAESTPYTLQCDVAQADWGLVINKLDQVGMSFRDVWARIALVDENGTAVPLGDPDVDYKITDLRMTTDSSTGKVTRVYFSYDFNSRDIPDGYWEFRTTVFNQYDEPGNVWRLRIRIENGEPVAPVAAMAVPQAGDACIILYWSGGPERDRARYEVERSKWDPIGLTWGPWVWVDSELGPNRTSVEDWGSVSEPRDPWGSVTTPNRYQYRIRAVDIAENVGLAAVAVAELPYTATTTTLVGATTTTTLVGATTTTALVTTTTALVTTTTAAWRYRVKVVNNVNKVFNLRIQDEDPATADINRSVGKKATIIIENLPAGNYQITATSSGRSPLVAAFSLTGQPLQDPPTVLLIL
jgi:prepilin-type N-terminal cleavage/methylation domain-containing protein